jgi:hypothetical protein
VHIERQNDLGQNHSIMMEAMRRWCQLFMSPAEMQDMMERMMRQKP